MFPPAGRRSSPALDFHPIQVDLHDKRYQRSMSDWLNAPSSDHRRVTIPTIWVTLAISLLIHIAVLSVWLPRVHLLSLERQERDAASGPLVVQLAPEPAQEAPAAPSLPSPPPSPPPTRAERPPAPPRPAVRAAPTPTPAQPLVELHPSARIPPAPPVIVAPASPVAVAPAPPPVAEPAPTTASLPPPSLYDAPPPPVLPPPPRNVPQPAPTAATPRAQPQVEGDLSSYIEARRRARGQDAAVPQDRPAQSEPSTTARAEDERERSKRIIADNLGLNRTPTVGYDPRGGGGIFEIQRISRDSAEFIFFGWNKDIRRNSKQLIEVARGDNSDIRIAVVRKMIAIIREVETGDFLWVSQRLGRNVTLSARLADSAELEEFMLQEFFGVPRRAN